MPSINTLECTLKQMLGGRKPRLFGACCRGATLPLYWVAMPDKGNSETLERIQLLERFTQGFEVGRVLSLAGDRECIGDRWFAYLLKHRIPFDRGVKKMRVLTK